MERQQKSRNEKITDILNDAEGLVLNIQRACVRVRNLHSRHAVVEEWLDKIIQDLHKLQENFNESSNGEPELMDVGHRLQAEIIKLREAVTIKRII